MNKKTDIPEDVIAEIKAGRKITAIKLLRNRLGVDLKEARQIVDAYIEQNPAGTEASGPETDTGIGRVIIVAIGAGVIYGIYKLLV